MPRLTDIPPEILEQILLYLPGQDAAKMEVISRQFQELTRGSPILQHTRDLFSAGLIENPCNLRDFAHRRKVFEEYRRKWSNEGKLVKAAHELPEDLWRERHLISILGGNLLVLYKNDIHGPSFTFLRLPPVTSGKPIERWSIPPLHFGPKAFAVYSPDNVLVVTEIRERSLHIHFLNLSDGSTYRALPSDVITWEDPRGIDDVSTQGLAITGSRIMARFYCWVGAQQDGISAERLFVWDWKTGDLVLGLPSAGVNTRTGPTTSATFLDEFRILVSTPRSALDPATEFTLFDTLVPHGHRVNSRRFRVPPRYYDWGLAVHVDSDRCLGTLNPFTTDPTQAIFVLELVSRDGARVLLIVRTRILIECMRSTSADAYVPWGEWERGVVIMKVPMDGSVHSDPYPLVRGLHVILVKLNTTPGVGEDHPHSHLCTFDLSRRGWGILPRLDEGDGAVRRISFETGQDFSFQTDGRLVGWAFDPLDDGRIMHLGGSSGLGGGLLHIWELI